MSELEPRLSKLTEIVEALQKRMEEHSASLYRSEYLTRYVLVDPFLRALGWDTSNPERVWVDYRIGKGKRKRVDYALFHKRRPIAFVEAKSYGACSHMGEMDDMDIQFVNYCNVAGVSLGILTDGGCWLVHDVFKPTAIQEKILLEVNFAWKATTVARKALALSVHDLESLLKQVRTA